MYRLTVGSSVTVDVVLDGSMFRQEQALEKADEKLSARLFAEVARVLS